jgi:hypothetical protein
MTDVAIRVENLGKMYRIGAAERRPQNLREALGGLIASPSAYLQRMRRPPSQEETLWALKDVSFEVQRGEVVGIPSATLRASIGRNGAGKNRDRETRGWGDKEQGGVSPCHPLSPSPCLHFPHHRADGGLC